LEAEEASSEVVDARDEMSIEEQTLLDAVNELHSTLDATVANMQHQKEKADAAVESYNMEIWSSDLLAEFLTCSLEDCKQQAKAILMNGGFLEGWGDASSSGDRSWPSDPSILIPARLNELTLSERRAVFKFLLGELQGYKLRVEAVFERRNLREEKRREANSLKHRVGDSISVGGKVFGEGGGGGVGGGAC